MSALAAGITAGAALLGTGASAIATAGRNKKQRRWQEKMYELQNQRNVEFWEKQNQYNHPSLQMARLREAGLNPNLAFGSGSVANTSGSIDTASPGNYNPETPDFSGIGRAAQAGLEAYYDTQLKDQTIENLKRTEDLIKAKTYDQLVTAQRKKFDLGLEESLEQFTKEFRTSQAQSMSAQAKVAVRTVKQNIKKAGYDTESAFFDMIRADHQVNNEYLSGKVIREQINNLRKDGVLRDFEIKMNKQGITKSDPAYLRLLVQEGTRSGALKNGALLLKSLDALGGVGLRASQIKNAWK